jgi:ADP-L-glycero-D-manno-heptose 6-epimerase
MRARNMIEYIVFPDALKGKYQSHTEADNAMLRRAGYADPFLTVEQGVSRYCEQLLDQEGRRSGE